MNKNRMMSKIVSMIMGVVMCMTMLVVLPEESRVSAAITVFQQTDSRWSSHQYGYSNAAATQAATIGSGGCGILAFVNAVYYMNGSFIEPITLADWSVNHGYRVNGVGTAYGLYEAFANACGAQYNFKFTGTTSSFATLRSHLQNGGTAIYGAPGHIMCVVDYDASTGKYLLLDSYKSSNRGTYSTGGYRWLTQSEFTGKVAVNTSFYLIENIASINHAPDGCLDNYSGGQDSIYVRGWGFDPDDTSASARIDVYLWNPSDMTNPVAGVSTTANVSRVDVDNVFGCGANHGFEATLPVSVPAGTYYLNAAVIDTAGEGAYWLDGGNVTITNAPVDTTAPTLTSVTISDVTVNGYKVTIVASDNVGVTKIAVPTWTDNAGQDDLFSEWWNSALATKINDTTWTYIVKVSDHNNEYDWYNTDVYVYDAAGNETNWCGERVSVGLYTLNINPNGGSIKNESGTTVTTTVKTTKNKLIYQGTNHYSLTWTSPSRTGYTFTGYYTAASGGAKIYGADGKCLNEGTYFKNNTYQKASDLTVYAQWSATKYTVNFRPNGGTCDTTSKSVTYNSTYGDLPTPVWKGHVFKGWFTAETGGTQITKDSKVTITANQTLYAQWVLNSYTITLDSNDGTGETTSIKATWSQGYGTLPTLTRNGYTFLGWFTAADGGTEVTASTTVATNYDHTLYAHWQKNIIPGDVTDNGILGVTDAVMMQKYLLNAGTMTAPAKGDLTGDGIINAFDLAVLKRMLLNE